MGWEWQRPSGTEHDRQSLMEWWTEQVVMFLVLRIAQRANRRGDGETLLRMQDLARAGAHAEARAKLVAEFKKAGV